MQQFIRKAQQNTRNGDAEHDDEQDIHDLYKSDVRIAVVHVMLIDKYVRKQRQAQCADGKHADEQQAVSDFIRLFNVKTPSMEQAIGLLSGGNQQKVAIARGLMTRPKVLILDEPTRGVDVGAKKEIYQLINQFKADGLSIILVSSEMPEVLGMSDRIIVMHEGHLSGEFTREQATQEVLMAAAVGKLNRVNQE